MINVLNLFKKNYFRFFCMFSCFLTENDQLKILFKEEKIYKFDYNLDFLRERCKIFSAKNQKYIACTKDNGEFLIFDKNLKLLFSEKLCSTNYIDLNIKYGIFFDDIKNELHVLLKHKTNTEVIHLVLNFNYEIAAANKEEKILGFALVKRQKYFFEKPIFEMYIDKEQLFFLDEDLVIHKYDEKEIQSINLNLISRKILKQQSDLNSCLIDNGNGIIFILNKNELWAIEKNTMEVVSYHIFKKSERVFFSNKDLDSKNMVFYTQEGEIIFYENSKKVGEFFCKEKIENLYLISYDLHKETQEIIIKTPENHIFHLLFKKQNIENILYLGTTREENLLNFSEFREKEFFVFTEPIVYYVDFENNEKGKIIGQSNNPFLMRRPPLIIEKSENQLDFLCFYYNNSLSTMSIIIEG